MTPSSLGYVISYSNIATLPTFITYDATTNVYTSYTSDLAYVG